MKEYDVAIVGSGPIGGFVSGKISSKKFSVAVFEKNKEIGLPLNCAGLVTPRVFDFLNISKKNVTQNEIIGANIHSPNGNIFTIGGDRTHALVIDRVAFDKEIMKHSKEQGTELFLNNKVLSAQRKDDYVELKTSENIDVKCKLLIGADGPFSMVRDRFVFPEPKEFLLGFGAEITNANCNPDFVEIFVGNNVAPGFFAWIIPTDKDGITARVGLCVNQKNPNSPKFYFSNFMKKNKFSSTFLKNAKTTCNVGGVIPLGVLKKTFDSNIMLVGDAAAQVKPTSGGGVFPGLLCAGHCSNVAIEALKENNFSSQFLKKYQKLWLNDFGRELNMGLKFRSIYRSLSDKQIDKYLGKLQNPKIIDLINKHGDIDYPSKLVKPMIKKLPLLLKLLPSAIKE